MNKLKCKIYGYQKTNILILDVSHHIKIHQKVYSYLLEKFGIKEIKKYIKWFIKKYGKKT